MVIITKCGKGEAQCDTTLQKNIKTRSDTSKLCCVQYKYEANNI